MVDTEANRLTVRRQDGQSVTYDPKRLQGISSYQEMNRDFARGDRIQFTAPSKELDVVNRQLATIQSIADSHVTAKLDGPAERIVTFDATQMRHFDHGYAVTSHSSQGITADRVLVNMDTRAHPELINTRFAYVAVSRASQDAQIYTNDAGILGQRLSHNVSKSSAVDFKLAPPSTPAPAKEPALDPNSSDRTLRPEDIRERIYTPAEHERHYAPLNRELHPADAQHFGWRAETGTVQTYQYADTRNFIHIDGPSGQFYDREKNPITQEAALDRAMGAGNHQAQAHSRSHEQRIPSDNGQGFSL